MYPWKTPEDLTETIVKSIAFENEDFIFVDKPWGLGIHAPHPRIHKKNAHLVNWVSNFGDPNYCLQDVMPLLRERVRCPELKIARSLDRYESGLLVLGKTDRAVAILKECRSRSRKGQNCYQFYLNICRGTPAMSGSSIKERVLLRMLEIDQLGLHKQPVIEYSASKSTIKKYEMLKADVSLKIMDSNAKLSTSLLEIGTNESRRHLIRAYAASKASFILGDIEFSTRVKQILGVSIPIRAQSEGHDSYEPLHQKVRGALGVPSNRGIPLLCHLYKMVLQGKKGVPTINVYSKQLPRHFLWTMEQLNLSFNARDNDGHFFGDKQEPLVETRS